SSGADGSKPNGQNWFLTCGVSKNNPNSVWNPPKVAMSDLKMISSEEAASSSVFKPCAQYKSAFESAAKATGVPVVLLMSFALQESTCQAGQTGPNGEIGLMQITPEKCPSSGNCKDPYTNVMTGAKYFKSQLDSFGGDVLKATGSYNGWQPGKLSYSSTMAMKQYGCAAQQNLDYLDALFNGYCQGKDGSSSQFKSFNNLAAC
ncbi:lysozyme-like protein, partial [Jaminaea rosea]